MKNVSVFSRIPSLKLEFLGLRTYINKQNNLGKDYGKAIKMVILINLINKNLVRKVI